MFDAIHAAAAIALVLLLAEVVIFAGVFLYKIAEGILK